MRGRVKRWARSARAAALGAPGAIGLVRTCIAAARLGINAKRIPSESLASELAFAAWIDARRSHAASCSDAMCPLCSTLRVLEDMERKLGDGPGKQARRAYALGLTEGWIRGWDASVRNAKIGEELDGRSAHVARPRHPHAKPAPVAVAEAMPKPGAKGQAAARAADGSNHTARGKE